MKIGDKIRYLRVKEDLTQKELAEKLGIKQNTISDYERNNITNISIDLIEKLSGVFGVENSYFLEDSEPENIEKDIEEKDIKEKLAVYGLMDYLIKYDIITDTNNIDDQTREMIIAAAIKDLTKMKKQR